MRQFTNHGLTFDVRDDGPTDGPVVVLLHGFPQDSSAWAEVTPRLVAAGMRVLAPDLRGYSPGARPRDVAAYRIEVLGGDVLALLSAAGVERAHVVGHDWGGALAWEVALAAPDRVDSLTVLSTPHPAAMGWAMRNAGQKWLSWYMAALRVPVLPERVVPRLIAAQGMRGLGLDPERTTAYERRMSDPEAFAAAIAWYRAFPQKRTGPLRPATGPCTVPTTYVWGRRDAYLGAAAALRTGDHCAADYRFVDLDADHWLPEKEPEAVADAILARAGLT
ncbi:alpha/beta fold hydrolase [Agilicoccus flavus]|uniref:alpha/beta fold hydrolase n=1 Tax=Agilicoccus flavus TaxID=2775968 RepID=UPI001CF6C7BF|nr:alpha/beta fold hydrolase [Agilicoccus flavus]